MSAGLSEPIEYAVEIDDLGAGMAYSIDTDEHASGVISAIRRFGVLALILGVGALVVALLGRPWATTTVLVALGIALCVLGVVLIPSRRTQEQGNKAALAKRDNRCLTQPTRAAITAEGLELDGPLCSSVYRRGSMDRVERCGDHIFCRRPDAQVVIIPARAFASNAEVDRFVAAARRVLLDDAPPAHPPTTREPPHPPTSPTP